MHPIFVPKKIDRERLPVVNYQNVLWLVECNS